MSLSESQGPIQKQTLITSKSLKCSLLANSCFHHADWLYDILVDSSKNIMATLANSVPGLLTKQHSRWKCQLGGHMVPPLISCSNPHYSALQSLQNTAPASGGNTDQTMQKHFICLIFHNSTQFETTQECPRRHMFSTHCLLPRYKQFKFQRECSLIPLDVNRTENEV